MTFVFLVRFVAVVDCNFCNVVVDDWVVDWAEVDSDLFNVVVGFNVVEGVDCIVVENNRVVCPVVLALFEVDASNPLCVALKEEK